MLFPRNDTLASLSTQLRANAAQLASSFTLIALWLFLYRALGDYLGIIVLREDFRTNQLILIGIAALIGYQIYIGQFHVEFHRAPRAYPLPFALALGGSLIYLVLERILDINTLSAVVFGIATYGFIGLWLSPRSWRAGLPAALLLIGVLPFGEHMQTFIGYPMRILTAELVRDALAAFHVTSGGVDTILVLENGVSQIDLPCSGVKSLWTGALFFLAVTWLERRALDFRWLGVAIVFVVLLFLANVLRVGALVVTAQVLNLPIVAEMLHVPLGVLGFVGACAAAVALFHFGSKRPADARPSEPKDSALPIPHLVPILAASLLLMGLGYSVRPETGLGQVAPHWAFPAQLHTEPLPLKPDETAWLTRDGAESASRFRFEWQGLTGSMILVPSRTWRAHHRPERCFEVFGLQLFNSAAQLVSPEFPLRAVILRDPKTDLRFNAAYWFQSSSQTTDDYGTRIWSDTVAPGERWVLVSILFDRELSQNDLRAPQLHQTLHTAIAKQLE